MQQWGLSNLAAFFTQRLLAGIGLYVFERHQDQEIELTGRRVNEVALPGLSLHQGFRHHLGFLAESIRLFLFLGLLVAQVHFCGDGHVVKVSRNFADSFPNHVVLAFLDLRAVAVSLYLMEHSCRRCLWRKRSVRCSGSSPGSRCAWVLLTTSQGDNNTCRGSLAFLNMS